jgi:hypothetical protein
MFVANTASKKKVGFILPGEIIELMDGVAADLGGKERWVALSAAIIALAQLPSDERNELFGAVKAQDRPGGSFATLIAKTKWGQSEARAQKSARGSRIIGVNPR